MPAASSIEVSITGAKNRLSALIDSIKGGSANLNAVKYY
jgi:hypothetical protein